MNKLVYVGFNFYFRGVDVNSTDDEVLLRLYLPEKLTPDCPFQRWSFYTETPAKDDVEGVFMFDWKNRIYVVVDDVRYVWRFREDKDYEEFKKKIKAISERELGFLVDLLHERSQFPYTFRPNAREMRLLKYGQLSFDNGFSVELVELDYTDEIRGILYFKEKHPELTKMVLDATNLSLEIGYGDDFCEGLKNMIFQIHPLEIYKAEDLYWSIWRAVNALQKFTKETPDENFRGCI